MLNPSPPGDPTVDSAGRPGPNRDYWWLWTGSGVAMLGRQLSGIAYPLAALAVTGSPLDAGAVGTVGLAARLVCRLPAGHLADRWNRRSAMVVADAGCAAVLAAVAVTAAVGALGIWLLVAAALAEGALGELYRPASTAAIRRVVPPEQMPAAVARLEARSYAATIAGPPLGGVLYSAARAAPFAGDAAAYTYSLLATLAVRTPLRLHTDTTAPRRQDRALTAGLAWLWSNQLLRALLLAAAGENFVFRALDLAVVLAARNAGATSTQIGAMLAIAGICGLAGALIATRLPATTHPSRVVLGIFWSTTALVPLMAIDPNPYLLGALLGAAGMLAPAANTLLVSYVIAITPDHLQGRVDAAGNFITGIATPAAPSVAALLIVATGPHGAFLALAALMAAVTLAATATPTIRHIPRLDQLVTPPSPPRP